MTRLMTWFIELQNRFNESRLFKISTIYILNWVDDLTSWHHENVQRLNVKKSLVVESLNAELQYTKIDSSKYIERKIENRKEVTVFFWLTWCVKFKILNTSFHSQ